MVFILVTHHTISAELRLRCLFPFWIDMAVPLLMVLSGYLYAGSYERAGIDTLQKAYAPAFVLRKLLRYLIPFCIVFGVQVLLECRTAAVSLRWIVYTFVSGGLGMGSYYVPVMLQFVFLFPILYFILKKYGIAGLLLCGALNFSYEILAKLYLFPDSCYRLLVFRYILVIAFGCWLQMYPCKTKPVWRVVSLLCGIGFITARCYLGYEPKCINTAWAGTSFAACLYLLPPAALLLRRSPKMRIKPLELIGRASYHIFLVQMLFFKYFISYTAVLFKSPYIACIWDIFVCVSVGTAFYFIESFLTKRIAAKAVSAAGRIRASAVVARCKRLFLKDS